LPSPIELCALCMENKELQESHLLPAGLLRLLRDDALRNPNPVLMSLNHVGQTSSQAKQHLLCRDCEQRLNKNGENWVINHCYHEYEGAFRLRDFLRTASPILSGPKGGAYNASQVQEIEIEKLVYFAASVIWRASLKQWRIQKQMYEPIRLGSRYQEEFRLFLLGEAPFPENAISIVYVSTSEIPPLMAAYPDSLRDDHKHIHRFHIPGIWSHIVIGKNLSEDNRRMCILRSPDHPICLYVKGDELIHNIGLSLFLNSKNRD
jgi:hypothetical protein